MGQKNLPHLPQKKKKRRKRATQNGEKGRILTPRNTGKHYKTRKDTRKITPLISIRGLENPHE